VSDGQGDDTGFDAGPVTGAPGMNDSPLAPSFREPPDRAPRKSGWVMPVTSVGGALIVFLVLIVLDMAR
jgi:hypothetical protein